MTSPDPHSSATLPIEEIARYPLPGMAIPGNLAFSPDDRLITYLDSPERSLLRQLYLFDPQTGERRLLLAPPEILDYDVEHEVCHLEVMDHSPRFWAVMERLMPGYQAPRRGLRDHGATLVL